jgi:hypothetical protein
VDLAYLVHLAITMIQNIELRRWLILGLIAILMLAEVLLEATVAPV